MSSPRLLADLPTPAALVDFDIVERNIARMAARAKDLGVRLRPHVKTHKCMEAARLQMDAGCVGITVSTLAEARFFAAEGFRDITYAMPIAPDRAAEAADIANALDAFHLLVDHPRAIDAIESAARARGRVLSVFLKIDCGNHRAGVNPYSPDALRLAHRLAASDSIAFQGLLTHAGQSYACRNPDEIRKVASQERDVTVEFAALLRSEGIEVREVSVGSTPTMNLVDHLDGVTEIRPGNYVFHDAFQTAIGSCTLSDTAFTVLATIVGSYPERGALIVDAGALALSKDLGARQVDPGAGYGVVQSVDRAVTYSNVRIHALSQEHGHVHVDGGFGRDQFNVGDKLRIVPNHSCLSAALFDRYYVVSGNAVLDEWRPVRGW